MNKSNLIPANERTPEELKAMSSKGGKASGASRRRKKAMKAATLELLQMPVTDTEIYNALGALGVQPDNMTYQTAILAALIKGALEGDVAAFKEIRDLAGESNEAARLKLQKKKLELDEARAALGKDEEPGDDNFIEALNLSARTDWSEDEPGTA